jgi:hypothetical protein
MLTEAQLSEKLDELGPRWSAVAMSLQALNIKGFRRHSCECPIARYIKQITGFPYVSVDLHGIAVGVEPEEIELNVDTPMPVSMFMSLFDSGAFKFLADRREISA